MVSVRRYILVIFVPAAMSSTMVIHTLGFPVMSIKLFGCFSLGIVVLVLCLLMLSDYFNGCALAISLGIADQIKIMGEHSLVLTGLLFGIYLWLLSEK